MRAYKAYLFDAIVYGKKRKKRVILAFFLTERTWCIGIRSVGTGSGRFSHAWQVGSQQQRERQKENEREGRERDSDNQKERKET